MTPDAKADVLAVIAWKRENQGELAAIRWLDGFDAAIESLQELAHRCPHAPEHGFFPGEIRHLIYKRHRVIYRVQDTHVVVLRVRHTAMLALGEQPPLD